MIVALETGGFIVRRRDSADRRRLVLNLTRSGQAVLDRYRPAVSAIEASMLGDINAADTARFRQLIMSCRQALLGG
jgi:DNA-binding MarR family transcriptional regulator